MKAVLTKIWNLSHEVADVIVRKVTGHAIEAWNMDPFG